MQQPGAYAVLFEAGPNTVVTEGGGSVGVPTLPLSDPCSSVEGNELGLVVVAEWMTGPWGTVDLAGTLALVPHLPVSLAMSTKVSSRR